MNTEQRTKFYRKIVDKVFEKAETGDDTTYQIILDSKKEALK